jgi:hypothetical protein
MGATAGPLLLTSFGTGWKFLYPASKSSIWRGIGQDLLGSLENQK